MATNKSDTVGGAAEQPVGSAAEDEGEDPNAYIPDGYESQREYLDYAMKLFAADYEADRHNIDEARKDLNFTYIEQWDPTTRAERERDGRPCLSVNTLPQFAGQVIGDRRLNQTTVKVVPVEDGDVKVAKVRSGLIKAIEQRSRARRVYDASCEDQVVCGISNFQIVMDYTRNDVFTQDIGIEHIPNPLAVIWDRMSIDPTGRDAKHCFVIDELPRTDFEEQWPDYPIPTNFGGVEASETDDSDWIDRETVKIVAFWQMQERDAIFALMEDGQVEDVTQYEPESYIQRVAVDPFTGEKMVREGRRTYAVRHLITAHAILEDEAYELPLDRLPVIKVSGRVGRVGDNQIRFGLIRWARDPILLRNYWRSISAETLALAPKAQWSGQAATFKGREDDFREAHLSGDPLLIHNDGQEAPKRVDPPALPSAVLTEATQNAQDIKDVTGIHDASLGIRSNEVSGKAINARQREGDVATITYHDNLNEAIQEGGDVINQLIPVAYDTMRMLRSVGEDDREEMVKVNDPQDADSPDLSVGKYDVALITGPSFTTQRMEAAESMMQAIQVAPQLMEIAGDLIVKAQDWPGAQEISERLKKMLPAAQEEKDPNDMTPEEQQAAQQQQQQAQQAAMLQQAQLQAGMEKMQIELDTANAQKDKAIADAEKAKADAQKAIADARKAEAEATMAEDEIDFHAVDRAVEIEQKANPPQPPAEKPKRGGASRRKARPAPKKRKTQNEKK